MLCWILFCAILNCVITKSYCIWITHHYLPCLRQPYPSNWPPLNSPANSIMTDHVPHSPYKSNGLNSENELLEQTHIHHILRIVYTIYAVLSLVLIKCQLILPISIRVALSEVVQSFDGHQLIHWGQVMHRCVSKLTSIGSDNGLSPGRHQAIIWTNAEILLTGPLGRNFCEISIEIHTFVWKKIYLQTASGKRQPFCLSLSVLTTMKNISKINGYMANI